MSVESIWFGSGAGPRAARVLLSPLAWLYNAGAFARNFLYDHALLRARDSAIPVVSVGNLSVGGTGKTPFAALMVRELVARGHHPALVMRGYGDDEMHLHARMNPGVPVITNADRVQGIAEAIGKGADVAVLDDGFQHRRAKRDLDIVLLSAEQWRSNSRLLPAGPMREAFASLARADLIVVTQKSSSDSEVRSVVDVMRAHSSLRAPVATVSFQLEEMISARTGERRALGVLDGAPVVVVAGIGDPTSFVVQVTRAGAVATVRRFRDHHDYTAREVADLVSLSAGHKYVVTTEKDAVKLSRIWPATGPELWYLSQALRITEGASLLAAALDKLFIRTTPIVG